MGKIKVLDKHIAELIAAGEVVERPGSALKELLENSIDSGATKVTIKVQCGGIDSIQVTDNGSGIEADDVRTAFKKNATSKIKDETDLYKISTLGFRGEALASICAVSKVEVITKTKDESYGTHYKINGGEEKLFEEGSCPSGTTVIVKDIFYNVPARMKFLKSNKYEGNLISKIVERVALSHPEVSFRLFKDRKEELNTPGDGKIESVVYAVFGKIFFESLVPLNYESDGLKIEGFITKPEFSSASRNTQIFFVNKRYIKSNTVRSALEEAYKGYSMVGKFPSGILYLKVPYDSLDVNVHPAKTEVRFDNEKIIYSLVYYAVKNTLNSLLSNSFTSPKSVKYSKQSFNRFNIETKKDKDLINFEKILLNKYISAKELIGSSYNSINRFEKLCIKNTSDEDSGDIRIGSDTDSSNHDSLCTQKDKSCYHLIPISDKVEKNRAKSKAAVDVNSNSNLNKFSDIKSGGAIISNDANSYNENPSGFQANLSDGREEIIKNKIDGGILYKKNLKNNIVTKDDGKHSSVSTTVVQVGLSDGKTKKEQKGSKESENDVTEISTNYSKTENYTLSNYKDQKYSPTSHISSKNKEITLESSCKDSANKIVENESKSDSKIDINVKKFERDEISKRLIGEAFKTYIILELDKNEIMFIDKHAAHERILYEKIKSQDHEKYNQMLLEPISLSLNKDEYEVALINKSLLATMGFMLEDFGTGMLLLRSAPSWINKSEIKDILLELIGDILDNKQNIESSKLDWIYKNMACRAAVKANDASKNEELVSLVQQIKDLNIKYCPHGRPVYFTISKMELEKKFFRK